MTLLESEARPQERAWERARALKGTHRRSKAREDITRLYRITARMGEPHCIICGQTNQRHSLFKGGGSSLDLHIPWDHRQPASPGISPSKSAQVETPVTINNEENMPHASSCSLV
ncbi:hypothetical protein Q8A67_021437 [Cirrhinus molitorella]|uniref:Uncharacterized protein n=1 Tax=Cirrhinus molitorella TaxID=172907 RepID=A0AA88TBY9_9TELE|nr:hypothetical protein Q8A67_021437 [Cirrhinus molitorella]